MSDVFHLNLTKAQLKGATLAIVPGDPARSERIAKQLDNPEFLASTREFTSWLGYINGQPIFNKVFNSLKESADIKKRALSTPP